VRNETSLITGVYPEAKDSQRHSPGTSPPYEVRLRRRSHNIFLTELRVGQNVSERLRVCKPCSILKLNSTQPDILVVFDSSD
jgi:hypothetical protein